jgi:pimeloyl-ACP methyl ester carboxylesterase
MKNNRKNDASLNEAPSQKTKAGLVSWKTVNTGLALAATAAYVRYKTRHAEWENPPQGNFIHVNGVRLHYVEKGEGQPLVLLHGSITMAQDFCMSSLVDMAARHYRVIVFDRPGYGYSERPRNSIWGPQAQAELLHDALVQLGVEKPVVLGHSWGTLVAMALALDYPQFAAGLVLADGYYFPTIRPDIPIAAQRAIPVIGDIMRYTPTPILMRLMWPYLMKRVFQPNEVPEHFKDFPVWMAARPLQIRASAEEFATLIPSVLLMQKRFRDLNLPLVIIAGSEDRMTYVSSHAQRLHEELPDSDYRLVQGAGHMLHHVAPEAVLEAIDTVAGKVSGISAAQRMEASEMISRAMLH